MLNPGCSYDFAFPIGANIVSYISEAGLPQHQGDGEKGPFEFAFGVPYYEYIAQRPSLRRDFKSAMSAQRDGLLPHWLHIYPVMEELKTDVAARSKDVIVDVAGNEGYDLISFTAEYPGFEGITILKDLLSTFA